MPEDFATSFINAFHTGRQLKLQQQQHANEQELHDLRVKAFKHQLDQAKLDQEEHLHNLSLKALMEQGVGEGAKGPSPGGGVAQFQPPPDQQNATPTGLAQALQAQFNPQSVGLEGPAAPPAMQASVQQALQRAVPLQQLAPSAGQLAQSQQQIAPNAATEGYAPTVIPGMPSAGIPDRTTTAAAERSNAFRQLAQKLAIENAAKQHLVSRGGMLVSGSGDVLAVNPDLESAARLAQQAQEGQANRESRESIAEQNRQMHESIARMTMAIHGSQQQQQEAFRSYQFHANNLAKLQKPIDDLAGRLGRLKDTLAQNNPQADALVAPELLTVMAGGQGSGLRMNEAEIARIIGGRSNWETLKASINKWQLDPSAARSITPAQDKMVRDLVATVDARVSAKQAAFDEAAKQLALEPDPQKHKLIMYEAHKAATGIDRGGSVNPTDEIKAAPIGTVRNGMVKTEAGWVPAAR